MTGPDQVTTGTARCRFCHHTISQDGRHWVDPSGATTCPTGVEDCWNCAEGEAHPHAPEPQPAKVHVLMLLELPPGVATAGEALLRPGVVASMCVPTAEYELVLDHDHWVCATCGCSQLRYVETMGAAWDIEDASTDRIVAMGPYETEGFDELGYDGHIECEACCTRHRIPADIAVDFA